MSKRSKIITELAANMGLSHQQFFLHAKNGFGRASDNSTADCENWELGFGFPSYVRKYINSLYGRRVL